MPSDKQRLAKQAFTLLLEPATTRAQVVPDSRGQKGPFRLCSRCDRMFIDGARGSATWGLEAKDV
jgi:hypothetical protein